MQNLLLISLKIIDWPELVGQPSAGANGDINPFDLIGGYSVTWTGMQAFKHDGSQHHNI
jgi:hypothetical protein